MQCLKTGCVAYITAKGAYVRGDLYQTDFGQLLMRVSAMVYAPDHFGRLHLDSVKVEHWFDRGYSASPVSTLLIASAGELCSEGRPL